MRFLTIATSCLLVHSCFLISIAVAADEPADSALAHDLFDQGRELMSRKDYEKACQKFEDSRKADPHRGGGGTLLNLALCYELSGRTGTAWALFRTARSVAIRDRRDDRRTFAEEHIASLAPRLLRLRVVVPTKARFPGLQLLRDGLPLSPSALDEALVVDPGTHVVTVSAPGRTTERLAIEMTEQMGSRTVTIPTLLPASATAGQQTPRRDRGIRTAGILVSGAGLGAVVIGGILGVRAIERQNAADDLCPDYTYEHQYCNPAGIRLSADAAEDSRLATGMMVGGAVVLTVGVLLYVLAPAARAGTLSPSSRAPFTAPWSLNATF